MLTFLSLFLTNSGYIIVLLLIGAICQLSSELFREFVPANNVIVVEEICNLRLMLHTVRLCCCLCYVDEYVCGM